MRKTLLLLISVHLLLARAGAQELGANYNENIGQPITEIQMLRNSGISWVRGFINVHSEFLTVENNVITGVDEDAIRSYSLSRQFMAAKASLGDGVKFMLSLKIPFGEDDGLVPEVGSEACEHVYTAVRLLLESFDMGKNISLLVMGNEPMWENWNADLQDDDAQDYKAFLNEFADRIAQWKEEEGWTFEVFAGSLNRISEVPRPTIQAVMDVVNENPNVDGLDLHLHCFNVNQAENDLRLARETYHVTKKLICTEFSMVRKLEGEGGTNHRTENIGSWGTSHGYSSTMKLWEYLDMAVQNASAGNPVGYDEFASLFESFSWYPDNWFSTFYKAFKKYDTYAITGRFSVVPNSDIYNFAPTYTADTRLWELGAVYVPKLLGFNDDGTYVPNPLVYPDFIAAKNGMPVEKVIEGQREALIVLGNGIASPADFTVKVGQDGQQEELPLDDGYVLLTGLTPATSYSVSIENGAGDAVWTRSITTSPVQGQFPLLKYTDAGGYTYVRVENLPDDAVSCRLAADGKEISPVMETAGWNVLTAEITYSDGSVETISTEKQY